MLNRTAFVVALTLGSVSAQAASHIVDASAHAGSGGMAFDTMTLAAGESFSVLAGAADLWSTYPQPRQSNAGRQRTDFFALSADESYASYGMLLAGLGMMALMILRRTSNN